MMEVFYRLLARWHAFRIGDEKQNLSYKIYLSHLQIELLKDILTVKDEEYQQAFIKSFLEDFK